MELTDLLLSAQGALLSEVTPNLRAVTVRQEGDRIVMQCIFDGSVSDDDYDSMTAAAAEIEADHFPPYWCDVQVVRVDTPKRLSDKLAGHTVYRRKEY